MRVELLLERRRKAAVALMVNGGTARRIGSPVTDDDGVVTVPSIEVYSGPAKLQTTVAQADSPVSAGHQFLVDNLQLHFPVGAPLMVGDEFTIEQPGLDPSLVGLTLRLVELARGSQRTAARWNVELVTA